MRLLEIATNWIVLICLIFVPCSLILATAAMVAQVICHGWG